MTQRDEGHDYRDSKNKAQAYERKQKYEAIINMVIYWLNSNIDEYDKDKDYYYYKNQLSYDSQELKEKIEIALDPSTTKKQIEDGDL
jgi:hypothetical protein